MLTTLVKIRTASGSEYLLDEEAGCVKRTAPVNIYCPPEARSPVDQAWPNGTWQPFERMTLVDAPVIGHVQLHLSGALDPALDGIRTSWVIDVDTVDVED
jgi:hypothetical protein